MNRRHVVISGTGRAGTTFLVQLLTHLGLDTGYDCKALQLAPIARAGLERTFDDITTLPYIVKSTFFGEWADELLESSLRVEHAIIPVRQFDAAAASRAHIQKLTTGAIDGPERVHGGLIGTDRASDQAGVLRSMFTKLIEALVRHDVPMTFLWYPRLVHDPDYVYLKLAFLVGHVDRASFRETFNGIARPDWTHQFAAGDS